MLEKQNKNNENRTAALTSMHGQHLSISLEYFVGGEGFNKVIVQVAAVRALLDVAVL